MIHIEQQWAENLRTTEGMLMHKKAHDDSKFEKRGDLIIMRGLRVKSSKLKVTGICDVVEFRKDNGGIPLNRYEGRWQPYPVEYKNGEPKESEADVLQLCGQAMCLEEMLPCTIKYVELFYGKIKHRVEVEFTDNLRKHVVDTIEEMQSYWKKGWTPRGKLTKSCYACSLNNVCLPELEKSKSVNKYIQEVLQSDGKIT